jgi:hypothetical protein
LSNSQLPSYGFDKCPQGLAEVYRTLVARGKKPIVALTALMRKLIVIANAKLRDARAGEAVQVS